MSWGKIGARVFSNWFSKGASKGVQAAEHITPLRKLNLLLIRKQELPLLKEKLIIMAVQLSQS